MLCSSSSSSARKYTIPFYCLFHRRLDSQNARKVPINYWKLFMYNSSQIRSLSPWTRSSILKYALPASYRACRLASSQKMPGTSSTLRPSTTSWRSLKSFPVSCIASRTTSASYSSERPARGPECPCARENAVRLASADVGGLQVLGIHSMLEVSTAPARAKERA